MHDEAAVTASVWPSARSTTSWVWEWPPKPGVGLVERDVGGSLQDIGRGQPGDPLPTTAMRRRCAASGPALRKLVSPAIREPTPGVQAGPVGGLIT